MAGVVVRPGLYRDVLAGLAWMVLRKEGCMTLSMLRERLQRVGVEVSRNRLLKVLTEYHGTFFKKVKEGSTVRYCAVEKVA